MAELPPTDPDEEPRSLRWLIGLVAALAVAAAVIGVLLFHFAGGAGPNTGGSLASPGPAQPMPTHGPSQNGQP
ncbi:MAG: hypothetical protein JOY80_07600 [Candidatus Dormibacteraeota bacterium]|nr:hypothetical protein [Candidatus Dormibacteraeota bacterium]